MADPVTAAIAVTQVAGGIMEGNAAKKSAKERAYLIGEQGAAKQRVYESQANAMEEKAAAEKTASVIESNLKRNQYNAYQSQQLTSIARAGFEVAGTMQSIIEDTAKRQEFDLLIDQYGSEVRQAAALNQADMLRQEGVETRDLAAKEAALSIKQGKRQAKNAMIQGVIKAGSTSFNGGGGSSSGFNSFFGGA